MLAGVWTADGLARSAVESAVGRAVGTETTLEGMELTLEQRGTRSNVTPILASVREATADRAPEGRSLGERAEETLRDLVPGGDDDG